MVIAQLQAILPKLKHMQYSTVILNSKMHFKIRSTLKLTNQTSQPIKLC